MNNLSVLRPFLATKIPAESGATAVAQGDPGVLGRTGDRGAPPGSGRTSALPGTLKVRLTPRFNEGTVTAASAVRRPVSGAGATDRGETGAPDGTP